MDPHDLLSWATNALWALPIIAVVFFKPLLRVFGVVIIPKGKIGQVNKKFVIFGRNRNLPGGAIIALNREAGYQADTLAPGVHYWLWPWQYEIVHEDEDFVLIPEGHVGVVDARDGAAITDGRVFGKMVECDSFQHARAFLEHGGERGPQIAVILPGTYRINRLAFKIKIEPALDIADNMVGVVTTKDGKPLPTGEIAGK